jgi:Undecaprenyl-phosphate glucose phosphotransferase
MRQGAALHEMSTLPAAPPWSNWHMVAAVQITDAVAILVASVLASVTVWYGASTALASFRTASVVTAVVTFIAHCVLRSMGAYNYGLIGRAYTSGAVAAGGWLVSISPLLLLTVIRDTQNASLQAWVIVWLACAAFLIVTFRLVVARANVALRHSRQLAHTVCIIGAGDEARSCAAWMKSKNDGTLLLGYFWSDDYGPRASIDAACLGPMSQLLDFLLQHRVDELIIATSLRHHTNAGADFIAFLRCLPVSLAIWPESLDLPTACTAALDGHAGKMVLLRLGDAPLQGWRWLQKELQDRTIAALALTIFLPVLIGIAIGIKLSSPGPVLFRQEREGYCGRKFRIYKFRTMHVAASQRSSTLVLASKDDQRCYPFGSLLRRTSLDELPQLLNVLTGDMWVIGPRPHSPLATAAGRLYSEAVRQYAARHRTKPGITGWAQINGWRGPTVTSEQIEQRVAHDIYYIENWSPLLDLKILAKTAVHGFVHQNAF